MNDPERKEISNLTLESLESASERSFALNLEHSRTLVIYCADPRFRSAFQQFISMEPGISHHTILSLAGGAGPFVLFRPDSVQAAQMIDQLRLFIMNSEIRKVVVLNHTGCKWYSGLMPGSGSSAIIGRQIADLRRFAQMVRSEIAEVSVQAYLAVLKEKNVYFKKVPID